MADSSSNWFDGVPRLRRSASGTVWVEGAGSGVAGAVTLRLSPRLELGVDRLDPTQVVSFVSSGAGTPLNASDSAALDAIGAFALVDLIEHGEDGQSVESLPRLRPDVQRLVTSLAMGECLHPIWLIDALLVAEVDSRLAHLGDTIRWKVEPLLDALADAARHPGGAELANALAIITAAREEGVETNLPPDRAEPSSLVSLVESLAGTVTDGSPIGASAADALSVSPFDLIDVDDVAAAYYRQVGSRIEIDVEAAEAPEDEIWAAVVELDGSHRSIRVDFDATGDFGTAVLDVPELDYWIEISGVPEPDGLDRSERATKHAQWVCAVAIAALQAVGRLDTAQLLLLDAASVFEGPACRFDLADVATGLARNGISNTPTLLGTELAHRAVDALRATPSPLSTNSMAVLNRLMVARQSFQDTDGVPIGWQIEEVERSIRMQLLPDMAAPSSVLSGDDARYRTELDPDASAETGITSIAIDINGDTVTVVVNRRPDHVAYRVELSCGGSAVALDQQSTRFADIYTGTLTGHRSTLRLEVTLGGSP